LRKSLGNEHTWEKRWKFFVKWELKRWLSWDGHIGPPA
jgi:hypothetical protein